MPSCLRTFVLAESWRGAQLQPQTRLKSPVDKSGKCQPERSPIYVCPFTLRTEIWLSGLPAFDGMEHKRIRCIEESRLRETRAKKSQKCLRLHYKSNFLLHSHMGFGIRLFRSVFCFCFLSTATKEAPQCWLLLSLTHGTLGNATFSLVMTWC